MASVNVTRAYVRQWRVLVTASIAGLLLAISLSLIQPLEFSSTIRLLITQRDASGLDPYTAIKSTERIGQNLSELVYSSTFFEAVMVRGSLDRSRFPTDEIKRRKAWRETIDLGVVPGTGIMEIVAYREDVSEARVIAVATAQELTDLAPRYFGQSVQVQIVDSPINSRFIVRPDFIKNGLFGAFFGFLAGSAYVLGRMKRTS